MPGPVWVVVLIKDFTIAKQRLAPEMGADARRDLAIANAHRCLAAAAGAGVDRVLAVCGSHAAATLAASHDVATLLEHEPRGQNPAARAGIERAVAEGAAAVLLVSSDLPLVTAAALSEMLEFAVAVAPPAVVVAPATGRGGTNALFIAPPDAIQLHFGDDSLARFESEAAARGASFRVHDSPALALDLDEPQDLEMLARILAAQAAAQ